MVAPVWITPSGDLGTIAENEFYRFELVAENSIEYRLHSGVLPIGLNIVSFEQNAFLQGIPQEVDSAVFNNFVVRALSDDGQVADRTFSLTVTGRDSPVIDSPDSDLGIFFDGDPINIRFTALDSDPADTLTWNLISGNLPQGISLSEDGILSGFIDPMPTPTGMPGFDIQPFDSDPFDFRTISENVNYQFEIYVTDGQHVTSQEYFFTVISRNAITSDSNLFTFDNSQLTFDQTNLRTPVLVTESQNIGMTVHDNFFAFMFEGMDFDGDNTRFVATDSIEVDTDLEIPDFLDLDESTGWFSGYIPVQTAITTSYRFGIRIEKVNNPEYFSDWVFFSLVVQGDIFPAVIWPDTNLGTIRTGEQSRISVAAQISNNRNVMYEIKSGGKTRLPQGLQLNSEGLLVGRVSFRNFMIDTGQTTFDQSNTELVETTFERNYEFTVRAFSSDGVIDTFETFSLRVEPSTTIPYESLYIKAIVSQEERNIYKAIVNNMSLIPSESVYRRTDSAFGIQQELVFIVATGISPATDIEYTAAMAANHGKLFLKFGDFHIARAIDEQGNTEYELIYIEMIDDSGNIAEEIDLAEQPGWSNPLTMDTDIITMDSILFTSDSIDDHILYPISITNMRRRIYSEMNIAIPEQEVLPKWMYDRQPDGGILGYVPAVPVVYCKPGEGNKILHFLERNSSIDDIRLICFEADRYILDNNLSMYYDQESQRYITFPETVFDFTLDKGGTRFFAGVDEFIEGNTNDQYIKFPNRELLTT